MQTVNVKNTQIRTLKINNEDYICITDIARQKNPVEPKDVVKNWLRLKNTIEYLGLWEKLYNPDFKGVEFDPLYQEAGSNAFTMSPNVAMFGKTAKQWREENPDLKGNIRDYASINQLICLSNMENLNAVFINDGLPQSERLEKLNRTICSASQVCKIEDLVLQLHSQ